MDPYLLEKLVRERPRELLREAEAQALRLPCPTGAARVCRPALSRR